VLLGAMLQAATVMAQGEPGVPPTPDDEADVPRAPGPDTSAAETDEPATTAPKPEPPATPPGTPFTRRYPTPPNAYGTWPPSRWPRPAGAGGLTEPARPAHGEDAAEVPPPDEPKKKPEPEGPYVPHWMAVEAGVRNFVIFDDGIDPYSSSNLFAQGAFGLTFVPFHTGPSSFGVTAEYDVGVKSHHVRFVDSSLVLHRIGLGLHAQVVLGRFRIFARAVPAAWYAQASLDDSGVDRPTVAGGWTWGMDATGGAAIRLGSAGGPSHDPAVRFWLLAELGYGFAGAIPMRFGPEEDEEDPRQYGEVTLPDVKPAGLVNRIAVSLSF
jgi:hypothetical protein